MKITTVGEMKAFLQDFPDDMPLMTERFVQRWSGDPEDTDLSDYEPSQIASVVETDVFKPWPLDDERRNDKRRTRMGDSEKCLLIKCRY